MLQNLYFLRFAPYIWKLILFPASATVFASSRQYIVLANVCYAEEVKVR